MDEYVGIVVGAPALRARITTNIEAYIDTTTMKLRVWICERGEEVWKVTDKLAKDSGSKMISLTPLLTDT